MSYVNVDVDISAKDGDVAVFQAQNGRGKSNFFLAIRWCLYGDKHKDKGLLADKDLVNRKAWANVSPENSATASVTLTFDYFGDEYQITRSITVDSEENVTRDQTIKKNGQPRAKQEFSELVKGIIPERIKEFFFYDGESQEAFIALTKGQSDEVRQAVSDLLSQELIDDAIDAVQKKSTSEIQKHTAFKKDQGKEQKLKNEIADLQSKIDVAGKDMVGWREAFDQAAIDKAHYEALAEKHKAYNEASASRKESLAELKLARASRDSKKQELISMLRAGYWLPCAEDIFEKKNKALADKSAYQLGTRSSEAFKKQISDWEKMSKSEQCPLCTQTHGIASDEIDSKIEGLRAEIASIEEALPADPSAVINQISELGFSVDVRPEFTSKLNDYRSLQAAAVTAETKYRKANIKLKNFNADEDEINDVVAQHLAASNAYIKARDNHKEASSRKDELTTTLNDTISELQKINPGTDLSLNVDFIRAISSALKYGNDSYKERVIENLEVMASETFCNLVSGFSGIRVEKDFSIKAILSTGNIDYGISHGQRKQLALSLVHAMLRVSLKDPFILMDSPETSLDEDLQTSLFTWVGKSSFAMSLFLIPNKKVLPNGKVAWLVKQEYLQLLGPSLANHYQIKKIDDDESQIVPFTDGVE